MKAILWILVFAFIALIVFEWGMGGFGTNMQVGTVGSIDKHEITYEDFERYARNQVDRASRSSETTPEQEEIQRIREQAWDDYIDYYLKNREAEMYGVRVTNREIAHIIQNYPPNEIQQADIFQVEGRFDINAYQNYLRQPQALQFLLGMEETVKAYLIEQKMNFLVSLVADPSDEELIDEFISKSAKAKYQFVMVKFDDVQVDSAQITDEMMLRYYRMYPERFKDYPQRKFAYVKFDLKATKQDSLDTFNEARTIVEEIRNGADFAQMAALYSEDAANKDIGGDLDWFGKGKMAAEFENASFNANIGDIVGPVLTRFGYHIIEVLGKRDGAEGEEVHARHILLKVEASMDTREEVYNSAFNFAEDVAENGFDKSVKDYNVRVDTTRLFSQAGYITGLGRMRMAASFCFDNPVGTASGVYNIPDGYVVFKIVEATQERTKTFEEVKTTVYRAVAEAIKENRAWKFAAELRAEIQTPEDFTTVSERRGIQLYATEDSVRATAPMPQGLRRDQQFIAELFRLEEGRVSDLIKGRYGYYIANIIERTPLPLESFDVARPALFQSMYQSKLDGVVKNWVRELRVAADLKDQRYQYYRDF